MNALQQFINDISHHQVLRWKQIRRCFNSITVLKAELAKVEAQLAEEEAFLGQFGLAMWIDPEPLGTIKRMHRRTLDGIRNRIVNGNLRLVVSCIKRYLALNPSLEYDLISEGCLGLIDAVSGFDSGRGFVFSTYACQVIKRRMQNVVNGRSVVINRGAAQRVNLYVVARQDIIATGNPNPSEQDIADWLNKNGPKSNRGKWTEKSVAHVDKNRRLGQCKSLEYEFNDTESVFGDSLFTEDEDPAKQEMLEILMDIVYHHLDARSRDIVLLRINGYTLKEIGLVYGITRERIRQVEEKALARVRQVLSAGRATRRSLDSIVESLGTSPQKALHRWLPGTRLRGSKLYLEPAREILDRIGSGPVEGYLIVNEQVEVAAVLVA